MNSDKSSALRKMSAYVLCMLMTTALAEDLMESISLQLYAFEQMSFGCGKIILNKIPSKVVKDL